MSHDAGQFVPFAPRLFAECSPCDGLIGFKKAGDELTQHRRRWRIRYGQFIGVAPFAAPGVVRLEFAVELGRVVVVVGGARGLDQQSRPVDVPLAINREEVDQVAREPARGKRGDFGEHQVGEADDRESRDMFAGLVFSAMAQIGPRDFHTRVSYS